MTPLDQLLTAVFADASPEGGGYAAAPLPLAPWVRLVKGALSGGVHYGLLFVNASNPVRLQYQAHNCRLSVFGHIAPHASFADGDLLLGFKEPPVWHLGGELLAQLYSPNGYEANGYTLRATSPTDITLSLAGETVTAEFNPPLKAKYGFGVDISTIKATERQLTIVLPGILPDKVIPLGEAA